MVVGEIAESVDLLVVGAGPGGYSAALRAAELGRSVMLVERDGRQGLGGTHVHSGWVPVSALTAVADLIHRAPGLGDDGVLLSAAVDLDRWQRSRGQKAAQIRDELRCRLEEAAITLVEGTLRFTRPAQAVISAGDAPARFVEFSDVVLATGSRPAGHDRLRRDGKQVLDPADALALEAIPGRLAVVGAGPTGVVLATALAKLGATVTLIEGGSRILPAFDPALVGPVRQRLQELGVTTLTGSTVQEYDGANLILQRAQGRQQERADLVVLAVGRRPNTDDLGLDRLGGLSIDGGGRISVGVDLLARRHVAAVGDITAGPLSAHRAAAQGPIAVQALSGALVGFEPAGTPLLVMTDPPIGTFGLSVSRAEAAGIPAREVPFPARPVASMTLGQGGTGGRLVVDQLDVVIGAQLVGPDAAELLNAALVAIEMQATVEDLAGCMLPTGGAPRP